MVISKVEALPVGRAEDVVWSVYDRILNCSHMCESLPPKRCLEYLNNRVRANLLADSLNWLPVIDGVYVKFFGVRRRRDNIHAVG